MAEYRLTPAAERDLEAIWGHTVREWGVERHMIYFRATDYGTAVVRVLHERMDAPRHL